MPRLSAIVAVPRTEQSAAVLRPLARRAPLAGMVRHLLEVVTEPGRVVVAVAEPLARDVRELLVRDGTDTIGVVVAAEPATRAQCLAAALESVAAPGVSDLPVLVHDVRQPLTSSQVRDRVVERLVQGAPVVLPVLAVTDSVKAVDEHGAVVTSVDRSTLQAVQFPRGFAAEHLARLLAASADGFDEALEAVRSEMPISTVAGDAEAFTADLPLDAPFLEAVIASR
ncbi:hypothetical protein A5663_20190 [Mycobacterium sp. E740]|nr:hypothetical protein A5663_20190 [Mycobacterium sp. E740]